MMELRADNSKEQIIPDDNFSVEEDDFISIIKQDGKNEILSINLEMREILIKLLGNIKQNFEYFSSIRDHLQKLITKLEELILFSYDLNHEIREVSIKKSITFLNILFELFIILFQYNTNNSFTELYLNFYLKFLKKIGKLDQEIASLFSKHFSHFYVQIYHILIDKKIEYVDKLRDSKISLKITKIIFKSLDKIDNETFSQDINILDLFNFLLITKNNLFALSNDIFLDKVSSLTTNIFKQIIFRGVKSDFSNKDDILKILEILLSKMLEIAKFKDDLKNSIEYSQQIFYVNTLILCLKLVKIIMKGIGEKVIVNYILNEKIKEKLTRVIIELSFWDNYSIVINSCELFGLLWEKSLKIENFGMRFNLQKIIEYLYIRRYQTYYDFLGETEDSNIKLTVLEIITKSLNKIIDEHDFLIFAYINYDLTKINYNLVSDLLNSISKYYNLTNSRFDYLKKLISITFLVSFNRVLKAFDNSVSTCNNFTKYEKNSFLKNFQNLSDIWVEITKMVNNGKFKKFKDKLVGIFKLKNLPPKAELKNEPEEVQKDYKKVAKSLANYLKYSYCVDINVLYETIADNHDFSNLIMEEYCGTFDFKGMDIIKAYETLVSSFKLGGEPHQIYNIIMIFSKKFYNDNKNTESFPYKNEDEVTTLAYSILILNTDLHNPNLTKHMTCEEFIKNNFATKLFETFSTDIFKNIYKRISQDSLKVANPRIGDYTKSEELFMILKSKKLNSFKIAKNENLIERLMSFEKCPSQSDQSDNLAVENILNFPYLILYENFNITESHTSLYADEKFKSIYYLLWEDLFYSFMSLPYKFYEMKDGNTLKILENVCMISKKIGHSEYIDKLIMTLHSIINSDNLDKRNLVNLYNLFFNISINFSQNFHSYLEIYFEAILDIIKHKIADKTSYIREYSTYIDSLIQKTFHIIYTKRNRKINSGGIFDYLFSRNSKQEVEYTIEEYKKLIFKNLKFSHDIVHIKNFSEDLIELNKIIKIIQNQDEEFIFFVTLAASKILDLNQKGEHYYSLIFLNEILDKNLPEKEFMKIWQNLFNIFKSKMEFKRIFDKEENIFDLLFANHFLYEIITRFSNVIEIEDYFQILENYQDIDNIDVLFCIMENNDKFIVHLKNYSHRKIIDRIFEQNVNLIFKLLEYFSSQIISVGNNTYIIGKLNSSLIFFKNLIDSVSDITLLSSDSLNWIFKVIKIFYENNIAQNINQNSNLVQNSSVNSGNENKILFDVVNNIVKKIIFSLPKTNDEKWDVFIFVFQFSLKSCLSENEEIQKNFFNIVLFMFENTKFPMLRFKEINSSLVSFYNGFITLRVKYENFWIDIFKLFYSIFTNNDELFNMNNEIECLWNLFLKKFLISFVDYNKKANKINEIHHTQELSKIFEYTIYKIKTMNERPGWWEAAKNIGRLYYPDLMKDC